MVIALNFIHKLRDRKGLLRSWEIPLGVASFAALIATRRYLLNGVSKDAGAEEWIDL